MGNIVYSIINRLKSILRNKNPDGYWDISRATRTLLDRILNVWERVVKSKGGNIMDVVPISSVKKKKQKKKERMITPTDKILVRQVPLGEILKNKKYKSFNVLRADVNRLTMRMRSHWMDFILLKAEVYINFAEFTRREIMEIYEKHEISIVNVDNVDRVYKANVLLGEWDRERLIYINDEGKVMIQIRYSDL